MLRRAARRRGLRDSSRHLTLASQQLYLPWLCPAQLRWNSTTPAAALAHLSESKRSKSTRSVAKRADTRSLATAAGELAPSRHDSLPFDGSFSYGGTREDPLTLPFFSNFKTPDPSQALVLKDLVMATEPPPLAQKDRIRGEVMELLQNVNACLVVGRFSRAKAIVRRLQEAYRKDGPELLALYQQCIKAVADAASKRQWDVTMRDVQRWFEVEVRGQGIKPDVKMYATMLRACMTCLDGPARERAVRRYLHFAQQDHPVTHQQLISSDILSDIEDKSKDTLQSDDASWPLPVAETLSTEINTLRSSAALTDLPPMPTPEVRSVVQKGLGLGTLRNTLNIYNDPNSVPYPHDLAGTKEEKDKAWAYMRQLRVEEDVYTASLDRWRKEVEHMQKLGISSALQSKPLEALLWRWHAALVPLIEEELKAVREEFVAPSAYVTARLNYGPFLESLPAKKTAAIALITILQEIGRPGPVGARMSYITDHVGTALQNEVSINRKIRDRHGRPEPRGFAEMEGKHTALEISRRITQDRWPANVKLQIGAFLVAKTLEVAKISTNDVESGTKQAHAPLEPAFSHHLVAYRGKKIGVLWPHEALWKKLTREPVRGAVGAMLPMLVEPRPWKNFDDGGFLTFPTQVLRINSATSNDVQRLYILSATEKGDLEQAYAALDVLGRTPWRINPRTLDVMLEVWNSGQRLGKIVPETPHIDYPPEPEPSADPRVRSVWRSRVAELDRLKTSLHSQRCFQNFQLEVARAYRDEVFYYPHNMDFRGRAYPIPPYLNHLGADHARGLLMFGVGKELGTAGLKWLKVQLANLFGFDKASLKEREEFTMQHIDDVYDSATNPITGRRWWQQAEDPWQCLAACFELKSALDSPDPSRYVSCLPVHQDGTCNGLQHYAALGGDMVGASQVNLVPGDRPADIYTAVAQAVIAEVKADAEQGNPMALVLDGKIKRKVVKQPIMTNVYGVTYIGAVEQVKKQLEDVMPNFQETPDMRLRHLAGYIVTKLFKALSSMFQGAHDIQDWFGECAGRISTALTVEQIEKIRKIREEQLPFRTARRKAKSGESNKADDVDPLKEHLKFKSPVIWTTPLRLPVVQPYREMASRGVVTVMQRITILQPNIADAVSKRKHVQGFPPNFVHSLDATHMMLSALKCHELGLTFASVHDSYWTHAADVPLMNRVLRDAFIRMHSENIVGRLAAEFATRYKGCLYQTSIPSKSRAGKQIIALRKQRFKDARKAGTWNYGKEWEIIEEYERQRSLNSDNLEERKRGEDMVTPASIILADPDPSALLVSEDDIKPIGLGRLPRSTDDKEVASALPVESDGLPADTNTETDVFEPESIVADEVFAETNSAADLNDAPERALIDTNTDADADREAEHTAVDKPVVKPKRSQVAKIDVWLPLTFPPVPKRGDFDVSMLRDSQYFFS